MRYQIRPLHHWDRPETDPRRSSGRFRADWDNTLDLLCGEVEKLGGSLVVIQIDVEEGDLRRDGMLYARAKVGFPGVKVSFDSKFGPLTYATDAYDRHYNQDPPGWQANLRAVALGLEALRAVDRHGITRGGEQYRGWSAIPARAGEFDMTRDQAAALLAEGVTDLDISTTAQELLSSRDKITTAYRMLAKRHHPDRGGDNELFRRITTARDLLLEGN